MCGGELELVKLGVLKTSCPLMFPALDPELSHLMVFGGKFLFILSNLLTVFALLRMQTVISNHTGLGNDAVLTNELCLGCVVAS